MSTERNFNDFYLGDNVYELADGLIPEIAERADIRLGSEPNSGDLGNLVDKLGPKEVLRHNPEVIGIDRETAVGFVLRSGVQIGMNRSLWALNDCAYGEGEAIVVTGAVANWQDRVGETIREFDITLPVYYPAGKRVMNTDTELSNPNVERMHRAFQKYPTEAQYASSIVVPSIIFKETPPFRSGYTVLPESYETQDGDELAVQFFDRNKHLLDQRLVFVRVANAGVQLAVQMRKAAQALSPDFDADPDRPQVFIVTDSFPISETEERDKQPTHYQKASTALRQVAVTAKMLHEAAGGE
jgi:hypothetical protein